MPPKPTWLRRIPQIRAALAASAVPFLDRAAIERLFGLGRRQAGSLAHKLGGYRVGNALAVDREKILAFLEAAPISAAARQEEDRRYRLSVAIDAAQREVAARRVRIPIEPGAHVRTVKDLPPTIRLVSGELRVAFADSQDLLRQLYQLSRAIAQDFRAFEDAVQAGPAQARPPAPHEGSPAGSRRVGG